MAFMTYCDNKDCRQEMEPVIDKETNIVYCTKCGKEIKSVTDFMKRQMVSLGQVKKVDKRKMAYSIKCGPCGKEGTPKLDPNNKIICCYCGKEFSDLNKPFAEMLKINLRSHKRDQG